MSRVLLVANTSWYLYNFRLPLLNELRQSGLEVALVAPHDTYTPLLQAEGFTVHNWLVARSSINPLAELHALVDLLRIYRRERPDLVHHFTIKACLYGTIAAKLDGVPRVINAVTASAMSSSASASAALSCASPSSPSTAPSFTPAAPPSSFRTPTTSIIWSASASPISTAPA